MKRLAIPLFIALILFWSSNALASQSNNYILDVHAIYSSGSPEESANFCFSDVVIGGEIGGEEGSSNYDLSIGYIYLNGIETPVVNSPPSLDSIGDKITNEGQALSFVLGASDPDGDSLTYSASNLPPGAIFNPSTKTFNWAPDYMQSGTYSGIHFQVTDNDLSSFENITIRVINVNRQPLFNSIGNKSVNENELLQFKVEASDLDGDSLTYSASNLPPGANFDVTTQIFSWTPVSGQKGVYTDVRFRVSDGSSSASEDIMITVGDATPPDKPTIDPVTSLTTNPTQTITGTKPLDAVTVIVGSAQAAVGPVSCPTSTTWSCVVTLQEGTNDFTVIAEDDLGNQSLAATAAITLDTLPPDFTITFPPDGSYIDRHGNAH